LLQNINPANLFRSSKPAVTPLPSSEAAAEPVLQASRNAAPASEAIVETKPASPLPAAALSSASTGAFVRYTYRGAGNTAPGDRAAAQRFAAKGSEAMTTKRYLEAANAFRSAAEADPSWFQAHLNRSAAALQGDRIVESLHAGETALALKPDSVEARYNFALALKRGNYVLDAAIELERLLASSPDQADAHLVLGNIYAEQLRQPEKARAHYLRVLELKPSHPRAAAIRFWLKANPK
jgi:tetratricopeptide (TPR) repeat protein